MARSRSFDNPMPSEGSWIKYQLDLRNIKYETVAEKAQCSVPFVSQVICGKRKSKKVEAALVELLGYPSWKNLWAAAFVNVDRRAG